MPTTPGGVAMRRGLIVLYKHSREEERIVLVIRLPEDIERRLADLAAATGRTKSFYAREAILEHLGDLEDVYLADQRLADLRAGRSKTTTLAEVMKAHDLAD